MEFVGIARKGHPILFVINDKVILHNRKFSLYFLKTDFSCQNYEICLVWPKANCRQPNGRAWHQKMISKN